MGTQKLGDPELKYVQLQDGVRWSGEEKAPEDLKGGAKAWGAQSDGRQSAGIWD